MYDIGILGGMGAKATAMLFDLIVDNTKAYKDQEHLNTVVLNIASIPDRTGFLLGKVKDDPLIPILKGIKELNELKVRNILIPCNTTHHFYEKMEENSEASIINMPRCALEYVYCTGLYDKVCVLGTLGTVKFGVYELFNSHGLEIVYPNMKTASKVHEQIYKVKEGIESIDYISRAVKEIMEEIVLENSQKIAFILACTELSCLNKEFFKEYAVIDALEVSGLVSILKSGKQIIENRLNYDYKIIKKISE